MSDLKKYLSEAISRGRTSTRYSAIQDLDFGMEIIEFWDKLVEIGVPDSTEDAKTAKVRKDILDHKGILVRKYLTTIYLFVGSSDHYYFISNDLGHDPREVRYISRNDRGAFPKEIGDQALDSLKKDLEDLLELGEINEAVSSGRRRHSKLDDLDRYISSDELIEILEELGYTNVKSDRTLDELSLFDQGPDRYKVVNLNSGTRVYIKSSNALYDYMSVCFDGVGGIGILESIYLFTIDTSGNAVSSRSDIKYLEKYITGKV